MRRSDVDPTNWRKIIWEISTHLLVFAIALSIGWFIRHSASDAGLVIRNSKPMKVEVKRVRTKKKIPPPTKKISKIPKRKEREEKDIFIADLDTLWYAITTVESGRKKDAIGDDGKAVGIAQIHRILVDDVNRILGTKLYKYDDRLNPIKSREMFEIYMYHYAWDFLESYEKMARIWNGGPTGHNSTATISYWEKVKKAGKFP